MCSRSSGKARTFSRAAQEAKVLLIGGDKLVAVVWVDGVEAVGILVDMVDFRSMAYRGVVDCRTSSYDRGPDLCRC